ncbi:anthocyanidin 3-O-glucosyltransferase 2-like, partial [Andrographis paniculata]|uniref:anthocyanidin 3-O-glucosyltransferase 2-like n=1 Tax=Andrographis paniculata TaxID=175694 RepID=UPI0021E880AE
FLFTESMAELIFIPSPGRGHLLANLEMAKLLVSRDRRLSATVLVIRPFYDPASAAHSYAALACDGSDSRIRFVDISDPTALALSDSEGSTSPFHLHVHYIANHKDRVREEVSRRIQDFKDSDRRLAGFVVDMFCTPMIDVAGEFGVPSYVFFTCAASTLGVIFHFQKLRDSEHRDITKYADQMVSVPSFRFPVAGKLMPTGMLDIDGGGARLIDLAKRFRGTKGILINTFYELESYAIDSLLAGEKIPPVYPVGPVLSPGEDKNRNDTMRWLDTQPDKSVVYLCFGSKGTFKEDQLRLIAIALERSGHRFLWSLRKPLQNQQMYLTPGEYKNPEEVLPQGFLERTKFVGKVIGWAPQVAVLSHCAVGGFVSHCGWNSTLESLSCGVPLATWPLYAEQQLNAFLLVKKLRVAVEIRMDYKQGNNVIVGADEIENGIRRLMESGSEIRANVEALKAKGGASGRERGSAFEYLRQFIDDVVKNSLSN